MGQDGGLGLTWAFGNLLLGSQENLGLAPDRRFFLKVEKGGLGLGLEALPPSRSVDPPHLPLEIKV